MLEWLNNNPGSITGNSSVHTCIWNRRNNNPDNMERRNKSPGKKHIGEEIQIIT